MVGGLRQFLANFAAFATSVHLPGGAPNVFVISTPRSGSTWMLEAITADGGTRPCNEPFNLRKAEIVERLGISRWQDLEDDSHLEKQLNYLELLQKGSLAYSFRTPRPFQRGYHPITRRMVLIVIPLKPHVTSFRR